MVTDELGDVDVLVYAAADIYFFCRMNQLGFVHASLGIELESNACAILSGGKQMLLEHCADSSR